MWSHVYLTAIPYTEPRPLKFFESCSECQSDEICKLRSNACGKLIKKDHGFEPRKNFATGRMEAVEVLVAIPHKVRPAVVIQSDVLNHDGNYHQVYVAPIHSLKDLKSSIEDKERIMKQNDIPLFHYIGKVPNDSIVIVADIKRVHKSLLLRKETLNLSLKDMETIGVKLSSLIEVKKTAACQECERNCDNCLLKKQAVNK